jgi:hypothetical protein
MIDEPQTRAIACVTTHDAPWSVQQDYCLVAAVINQPCLHAPARPTTALHPFELDARVYIACVTSLNFVGWLVRDGCLHFLVVHTSYALLRGSSAAHRGT